MRYMHSTDDTNPMPEKKARWKKCPICWDTIYISDTRPVRWYYGQEGSAPREGDDVVLRLIMRQPGSTLALPRDGADALAKTEDIPWYFAAEVADFARVMKGSEDYMLEQFDSEIVELQQQEQEDELMFGEESGWTKKAVHAIGDAKLKVKDIGNPPELPKQPTEKKTKKQPIQFNEPNKDVPDMYFIQHAAKSGLSASDRPATPGSGTNGSADPNTEEAHGNVKHDSQGAGIAGRSLTNHENRPLRSHPGGADSHSQDSPYFFYQALLHYYLAPLDIRILKAAFGDFASFPSTLLPRVERVSTGNIIDEEMRKRAKYLAHLPYGCEVGLLECDWTDVVGPEVLQQFSAEIQRRRKRNQDKEIREEKDRVRAEREEDDKRWASARRKRPSMTEERALRGEDFLPLASNGVSGSFENTASASPPWSSNRGQGSAFASLASPSTSPSAPRTVWGTTMITPTTPELAAQLDAQDGDDGWLQDWEKELMAENVLIAQVQAASLADGGESSSAAGRRAGLGVSVNGPAQGQKKKKAKKITLMSTTARRAA